MSKYPRETRREGLPRPRIVAPPCRMLPTVRPPDVCEWLVRPSSKKRRERELLQGERRKSTAYGVRGTPLVHGRVWRRAWGELGTTRHNKLRQYPIRTISIIVGAELNVVHPPARTS